MERLISVYCAQEIYPIDCFGCNQFTLAPEDPETEGSVLVNIFGLTVIKFNSVMNLAPTMFGDSYRGYLITFRYILVDGPGMPV